MSTIAEAAMVLAARHQLGQVVTELVEATQERLARAA
jgi:acyl-CoA hydrolase